MKTILIVVWFAISYNGTGGVPSYYPQIQMQEFQGPAACEDAKRAIEQMTNVQSSNSKVTAMCMKAS